MRGVVKLAPVAIYAPPVEAAYHMAVAPVEQVAPKVTIPVPQIAAGVTVGEFGIRCIVTVTGVLPDSHPSVVLQLT